MNYVEQALKEPTLLDALSLVALLECERAIKQAHEFLTTGHRTTGDEKGWDTCFKHLLQQVLTKYPKEPVEKILCSAVWFQDDKVYIHQPKNVETGFVVTGRRHHNCYQTSYILRRLGTISDPGPTLSNIQGFLTNTDRFVDRSEAYHIAVTAKQLITTPSTKENPSLLSEDIY